MGKAGIDRGGASLLSPSPSIFFNEISSSIEPVIYGSFGTWSKKVEKIVDLEWNSIGGKKIKKLLHLSRKVERERERDSWDNLRKLNEGEKKLGILEYTTRRKKEFGKVYMGYLHGLLGMEEHLLDVIV